MIKKYNLVLFLFLLVPVFLLAQTNFQHELKGKISAYANSVSGISVINIKTENATLTDSNGYFTVSAAIGDTLMFTSVHFKGLKRAVEQNDFESKLIQVKLEPVMNQLAEVMVMRYDRINAVDLGIIPSNQKRYTQAERKYKSASDYDAKIGLNTMLTIDPLLNMISGRTAMLRKEIEIEKKELLLQKIEYEFDADYFTKTIHIPESYVKGFQYYLIENSRFVTALNSKNKIMATFIMAELSVKYLDIIACENN